MRFPKTLIALAATTAFTGSLFAATPVVSAITVAVDEEVCATTLTVADYRHLLQIQNDHLNELFTQLKLAVPSARTDLDTEYNNALATFRRNGGAEGHMPNVEDVKRSERISAAVETAGFNPGEYGGIVMGAAFAKAYTEKSDAEIREVLLVEGEIPADSGTLAEAAATLAELESGTGDANLNLGVLEPREGASPQLLALYAAANAKVSSPNLSGVLNRALQSCATGTGGNFPLSDSVKEPEPTVEKPRRFRNFSSSSS
ncbi:hypothetical protein [Corynebacterium sp. A21]|uniref:hypothetical protein n=1 Tax=Corynebacterium sp. A21 TaxID=3457318 RepID=UPI003FD49021